MRSRTGQTPIDRGTAERILRDGPSAWSADDDPLAKLLAAATAPARTSELVREEMAMDAFRTAHRQADPHRPRHVSVKSAVAKLLTAKVAAVAAAVVGVGAVTLAASTGTIPGPLNGTVTSASHASSGDKTRTSSHPSSRPSNKSSDRPDRSPIPSGFPPGLYWLCHDYLGLDAAQRNEALNEYKFHELAEKAGNDQDKAEELCGKLLDRQQGDTTAPTAAASTTAPGDDQGNNDENGNRLKGAKETPPGQQKKPSLPGTRPSGPPTHHPSR